MNKRSCNIIKLLYDRPFCFDVQELADKFSVSAKTIRNDLDQIKEYIEKQGMFLEINDDGKFFINHSGMALYDILNQLNFYDYNLSKDERLILEFVLLIFSGDYITFSEIADFLCVSRSTVISDFEELNSQLSAYRIKTHGFSSQGVKVIGDETSIRICYMKLLFDNTYLFRLFFSQKKLVLLSGFNQCFNSHSFMVLQSLINENELRTNQYLTEGSFILLKSYLILTIFRMKIGKILIFDNSQKNIADDYYFDELYGRIVQYFDLIYSEQERVFLNDIVQKLRFIKKTADKNIVVKIQTITRRFIEQVSESLKLPLYNDYDFFFGLSNHLEHIFTGGYTQVVEYSDVNMIVDSNPRVKEIVADNVGILENLLKRKIQEQEIAYIVIYVCAAIEKYRQFSSNSNVILVCNSGIGTSQLLRQKINEKFNFNILNVVSAHTLAEYNISNIDFLISTIDLQNVQVPYVKISPLLNEEDYIKLREISRKTNTAQIGSDNVSEMLVNQMKGILKNYPELFTQVQQLVRSYFGERSITKELGLSKLLQPEFIEIDVEAQNWQDAIKKAARPLLMKGIIKDSYVKAMIDNVNKNGPYIVIAHGFALPHASIDSGSNDVGMSIIRLKEPVSFYSQRFDPVKYVCVLSAIDQEKHLKAFFNLVNLLKTNGFLDQLDQAKNIQEMAAVITRNEINLV